MSVALAAIADNGNFLAFHQINVSVPIVINAHFINPCLFVL